jgi:hypothetical protein
MSKRTMLTLEGPPDLFIDAAHDALPGTGFAPFMARCTFKLDISLHCGAGWLF